MLEACGRANCVTLDGKTLSAGGGGGNSEWKLRTLFPHTIPSAISQSSVLTALLFASPIAPSANCWRRQMKFASVHLFSNRLRSSPPILQWFGSFSFNRRLDPLFYYLRTLISFRTVRVRIPEICEIWSLSPICVHLKTPYWAMEICATKNVRWHICVMRSDAYYRNQALSAFRS